MAEMEASSAQSSYAGRLIAPPFWTERTLSELESVVKRSSKLDASKESLQAEVERLSAELKRHVAEGKALKKKSKTSVP